MSELQAVIDMCVKQIKGQMESRCYRAANELRNASIEVLSHGGSGRVYHGHVASAPGEPPAPDTGTFMKSWEPTTIVSGSSFVSRIESNVNVNRYNLGALLEYGTSKMAPRPHHERIQQKALPKIMAIYGEAYIN